MNKGFIKSSIVPSFVFRSLMVIVLAIYLLGPLQTQIYNFLHTISHSFLLENLSHNDAHTHNNDHHSHDFLSHHHHSSENHHHHHKKEHIENHTHKLLSFFNSIFNIEENQTDQESKFFKIKLDKHIIPKRSFIKKQLVIFKQQKNWFYNTKINSLRLEINTPPPKIIYYNI